MKPKFLLVVLLAAMLAACSPATPMPIRIAPTFPPTLIPESTATARPTPTPELLPYTVHLLEGDPYICPEQKIYEGQPMVINYDFRFPLRHDINLAVWFAKAGVVKVQIDESTTFIDDTEFWSKVETKKEKEGTFYYTTFRAPFPKLPVGIHKVITEYSVPAL